MMFSTPERIHLTILGWLAQQKKDGRFQGNVLEIGDGIFHLLELEGLFQPKPKKK